MKCFSLNKNHAVKLVPQGCLCPKHTSQGFTLVEVIVAVSIILVALVGTVAGFNAFLTSSQQTKLKSEWQKRIDSDLAKISKLSYAYTACINPKGSIPTLSQTCQGLSTADVASSGQSFYYFPPASADQTSFFNACDSTNESTHITKNFISAIDGMSPVTSQGVTRQAAVREQPTIASNHLITVRWVNSRNTNQTLRLIRIYPVVSAWCK